MQRLPSFLLGASSLLLTTSALAQEPVAPPSPPVAPMPPAPPPTPPTPTPPSPIIAVTPATPGTTDMQGPRVRVTVDADDKSAVVERLMTTEEMSGRAVVVLPLHTVTEKWEQVCVAPCVADLDRFSSYRIGHENRVSNTHAFTLPQGKDQLKMHIEPGNLVWHRIGQRLIVAGTAAAIVTGALFTVAPNIDDRSEEKSMRTAGFITGGAAVLLLGVGIPLTILTHTHVTVDGVKLAKTNLRLTPAGVVF